MYIHLCIYTHIHRLYVHARDRDPVARHGRPSALVHPLNLRVEPPPSRHRFESIDTRRARSRATDLQLCRAFNDR